MYTYKGTKSTKYIYILYIYILYVYTIVCTYSRAIVHIVLYYVVQKSIHIAAAAIFSRICGNMYIHDLILYSTFGEFLHNVYSIDI